MELRINTESRAAHAIVALTHKAGTSEIYLNTLQRLINAALFNQDDLGMDDTEALDTVRVLSLLKSDISDIAAATELGKQIRAAWTHTDAEGNTNTVEKRDPYNTAMAALALAVGSLGEITPVSGDHGTDIIEVIEEINTAANRLTNTAAYAAAYAENTSHNPDELNAAERARMFTGTAYYNAISAAELMTDALDSLERSGNKSNELAVLLKEAADAQKAAAAAIDYFRGMIYKADEKGEGGEK